jgi:hypothetical protein
MKTTKMSLANMQGKMSRAEMKNVNGGEVKPPGGGTPCNHPGECGSGNNWDCVAGYTAYACINHLCKVVRCS